MTQSEPLILAVIAAPEGVLSSSLRTFLRTIPGLQIAAHVTGQAGALETLARIRPQLLLFDVDVAGSQLAACLHQLRSTSPALNLVVLSNSKNQQQVALDAGASSTLLKGCLDEQLRRAIIPGPHQ
jgi:DNA-binding NarL/FixJ family response regulator